MSCEKFVIIFAGNIPQDSEALRVALAGNSPHSNYEPNGEQSTGSHSDLLSSFKCPMPIWGSQQHSPAKIPGTSQEAQL